eukprot:scaffold252346_cov15-Prasinocladus_malaysianus.AAC.1
MKFTTQRSEIATKQTGKIDAKEKDTNGLYVQRFYRDIRHAEYPKCIIMMLMWQLRLMHNKG